MSGGGQCVRLGGGDVERLDVLLAGVEPPAGQHAPSWRAELGACREAAWGVERGGELVGAAVVRWLGRRASLPLLHVRPSERRSGLGGLLWSEVRQELLRRDARVACVELAHGEADALAALVHWGFKPMHSTFVLSCDLPPAGAANAGAENGDDVPPRGDVVRGGLDPSLAAELRGLFAGLEAGCDPTEWVEAHLRVAGAVLLLDRTEEDEQLTGAAMLAIADRHACCSLLGSTSRGQPDALAALLGRLRDVAAREGAASLGIVVPSRQHDALRALIEHGMDAVPSALRLVLRGHPERVEPRRMLLTSCR